MRAIRVHQYGGPEVLEVEELPTPVPGPGEIVVAVAAAGINFVDTQQRRGYPPWYRMALPFTPGFEAAGRVAATGEGVSLFRPGDRVVYCGPFGAYATHHRIPASAAVAVPPDLDLDDAAAVMLQGMTAHYLTHDAYRVRPGDWILVHAGAGGTGGLVIQMARASGATVIATTSTPEKARAALACGAHHAVDYATRDFAEEVRSLAGFPGLAAVYDSVGQATFEAGLGLLRPRGCMVVYGAASGPVEPFDINRLNPMGSLFVTRPNIKDYIATRDELLMRADAVLGMVRGGELAVRIGATHSLAHAAEAHAAMEARATMGKLLLIP